MLNLASGTILRLILLVTTVEHQQVPTGKAIYEKKCSPCHGQDGTKGFLGAKNLQRSTIGDSEITWIILKGKKFMPSYKNKLTAQEIENITTYVKGLRK